MTLVSPLGGVLVDRRVPPANLEEQRAAAARLPRIRLDRRTLADLDLLGNGAYSPLTGFMTRGDYTSVVSHARLADGTPWTLPITLSLPGDDAPGVRAGMNLGLCDEDGAIRGTLEVAEVFQRDSNREALEVYRTDDPAHPGVQALQAAGDLLVGGSVRVLPARAEADVLTPDQTRAEFMRRGWEAVVAFQTRNPVHRAHEYLTKVALEQVDGLLLHPLSGVTKDDDIALDVRMQCYRVLLNGYYPPDRVAMSLFPAAMRYAGPREAVYHGLVRRNYGCSHFIIGRDAAGVGTHYGPYDAQHLYDELGGVDRLGFTALKFEHAFFCRVCAGMASTRTCPHGDEDHLALSGSRLREILRRGEDIPSEFSRPEVAAVLRAAHSGD